VRSVLSPAPPARRVVRWRNALSAPNLASSTCQPAARSVFIWRRDSIANRYIAYRSSRLLRAAAQG
jgi:hypothetical protein